MLLSGIPMHRIKNTDPQQDTIQKIKTIHPVSGIILDTATGLGYTAIHASRTARHVITVEFDPLVLEVCKKNPWSAKLFSSKNIQQIIGDVFDIITAIDDQHFDTIIHDPPFIALAGHLYSGDLYAQLYRVLKQNGKLFHYIGDPDSHSGRKTFSGVKERLYKSGFKEIKMQHNAFGLTATRH
jgi:predicted methyltransferase